MSGSPMSDSGAHFMLFHILVNFRSCFDFASMNGTESDASESREGPAQPEGEDVSQRAYTWVFRAAIYGNLVDSSQYSTFRALLDSQKERQEQCLGVEETITFTCSKLSETEPRTLSVEGIVHANRRIRGASLKQWLPMNHMPEVNSIEFEAVYPGRKQHDR